MSKLRNKETKKLVQGQKVKKMLEPKFDPKKSGARIKGLCHDAILSAECYIK